MNLQRVIVVARKELTDNLRDKRALYGIVLASLFGPLFIGFMLTQQAKQERAAQEIKIPIVGQENSPMLVHWLQQQAGVEVIKGPADPEQAVRDTTEDLVLVIKKDFAEKFNAVRPAPVQLVSDSNRMSAFAKVKRVRSLLLRFGSEIGSLRLVARGVSPSIASALKVDEVEISSAKQRIAKLFNFIPLFVIMAAFAAGMQIATDSTAGERERLSLEPLLINPLPRWQIVGGKWLASAIAALVGMAATLAITAYIMSRLSLEDLGVRFQLGWPECLLVFAAVAPMGLLAPAMQVYLACFAKTFKEAQTYMSFLIIAAIIPSMLSLFYPIADKPWMKPIPFLGQSLLANDILGGVIPPVWMFVAAAAAVLVVTAVFLWLATRLFDSENIIVGR